MTPRRGSHVTSGNTHTHTQSSIIHPLAHILDTSAQPIKTYYNNSFLYREDTIYLNVYYTPKPILNYYDYYDYYYYYHYYHYYYNR